MKKEKYYIYSQVQIVGKNWEYAYYFDINDKFKTSQEARNEGIRELGHDDFIVAEFEGDKCVAVDMEEKGRHDKNSKDFGEYVTGINRELGF